jgi:hypothetical protein
MIKKAFAAMALAALTISAQAAVVINEGFSSVPALAGSGWIFRNASTPGGDTAGWYQGTSSVSFYLRAAGEGYADQINFGFINADGSLTSSALSAINPVPDSGWTLYSAWIGADTLASARFAFQYTGTYDSANYVGLDSVSVDVPEPASIALLAGGLLGLGAMRRRSRR